MACAYYSEPPHSPVATTCSASSCGSYTCPDAFAVKLDPRITTSLTATLQGQQGSEVWGTYLGGRSSDEGGSIAVDPAGNVYVAGNSYSTDYPTTVGAFRTHNAGGADIFVTKLSPDGSGVAYSTLLGGSGSEFAASVAVDSAGHAYVAGISTSTDYPVLGALQGYTVGAGRAVVSKLNKQGSAVVWSTYLGGSGSASDAAIGLAVDAVGNVTVAGHTASGDFPTSAIPPASVQQPRYGGGNFDAFVARIDNTTRHLTDAYDGLNRLTGVTETLGNAYGYSYDLAGRRTDVWTNGAPTQHLSYDAADEITTATLTTTVSGVSTPQSVGYGYDAADQLAYA